MIARGTHAGMPRPTPSIVGGASFASSGDGIAGCSIWAPAYGWCRGGCGFCVGSASMGQPITVAVRRGARPEVRIFDLNRSLTGMALEVYPSCDHASGDRPPDVLARRLFDLGAKRVSVYSNVVTVEADAAMWGQAEAKAVHTLEHLFEYYGDDAGWSPQALGVAVPSPVAEAPETPAVEAPA